VVADCDSDLVVPPLPVRASIYIAPDGTVHFGALFAELVPVAAALGSTVPPTISHATALDSSTVSTPRNTISPPTASQ